MKNYTVTFYYNGSTNFDVKSKSEEEAQDIAQAMQDKMTDSEFSALMQNNGQEVYEK